MKKIYITFLTILILAYPSYAFGELENSCSIKDSAPQELIDYIKDIRTIVGNIGSNAESTGGNTKKVGHTLLGGLNSLISWNDYKTEFDFFLIRPMTSEVPYEVKRDDKYLAKEIDNLNKYLARLAKTGKYSSKIELDNVCSGVKNIDNCKLEGKASDIILKLIDNTKSIRNLLQLSTLGHPGDFDKKLVLVDDNFIGIIKDTYAEEKIKACSDKEDGFMYKIKESINNIGLNNRLAQNGIQKWKDSWALLMGTRNDYEEVEKNLLRKELSRQGVSTSGAEAILKNLDEYNAKGGFSSNNNLISNSFNYISNSINNQWNDFKESISSIFGEEGEVEKTSISDITKTSKEINNSHSIKIEIEEHYKNQIPLAQQQGVNTKNITTKLIEMHANLGESINVLERTIPISEKVCNDQATGKGRCKY